MNNETKVTNVDSELSVKAIGSISDVSNDLEKPEGKSINELIEQHEEKETKE
jgi:hypothetical protein